MPKVTVASIALEEEVKFGDGKTQNVFRADLQQGDDLKEGVQLWLPTDITPPLEGAEIEGEFGFNKRGPKFTWNRESENGSKPAKSGGGRGGRVNDEDTRRSIHAQVALKQATGPYAQAYVAAKGEMPSKLDRDNWTREFFALIEELAS